MGRRTSTSDVIDTFLTNLAAAGAIGITLVAPNSASAFEKPLENLLTGKEKRKDARKIGRYLKQQKLVSINENKDGTFLVTLTEKGIARGNKVSLESLEIPKEKWDEKWRVVTFDIPEEHKTIRNYISKQFRLVGFRQLQRSVFIYPYPVDHFIALLKEQLPEIKDNLTYMVVEEIDQHNNLVKQFKNIL